MKRYEENDQIQELLDQLEPDPATGNFPANEDELIARIDGMKEGRVSVLENLARMALDCRSKSLELKEQEYRLSEKRKGLDRQFETLINVLKRECPEKIRLGRVLLYYMHYSRVDVTDEAAAVDWLKEQKLDNCYLQPPPSIYKKEVRKLIEAGKEVPGCSIVTDRYCYLKSWDND